MNTKLIVVFFSFIKFFDCLDIETIELEKLAFRIQALKRKVEYHDTLLTAHKSALDIIKTIVKEVKTDSNTNVAKANQRRLVLDTGGPVAFSAVVTPRVVDHMHSGDLVQFDTVHTNYGGAYDNATGVFVAPIPGVYLFTSSILDHSLRDGHGDVLVHGEIIKNGKTLVRVYARAETGYRDQGANTVIALADAGDTFSVRVSKNDDLGLGGDYFTSFSGVMLSPFF